MIKLYFACLIGLLSLNACNTTQNLGKDEVLMYIAAEQVDCVGVVPMKCLQVKESKDDNWTYFYSAIDGFSYESGYEYELLIKKTKVSDPVPADASSIQYHLIKVLKKTKK